ncbi:Hypothetical predicted protein [Mytilus galloprovincialis]|uniref:G-protein coupled receptors family 1 profile domain-containing protein n=1 Tax=Mytilus galloprovincialis TaxID=29158 RepID=A0A8B6D3K9_MYTGA|nr:Hypothetical predicted protein [Mytilus galloprovincialis]
MENVTTTSKTEVETYVNTSVGISNRTSPVRQSYLIPWNNPHNVITQQTSDDILFVLQCIIFPIITLFGSTGNIMSLVILIQKKLRNSTGVILIAITFADLCFLITNMTRKSSCLISLIDEYAEEIYTATIFGPLFFVITSFSRVSAWLVVLVSIERVIAVTFPLKIKVWVSKQRMIMAVIVIYILTFVFLSPIAFQYKVGSMFSRRTNTTSYFISTSEFYSSYEDILTVHNEILGTVLFRYLPVFLTMLFNLIIIINLQRRSLRRKAMTSSKTDSKSEDKITRMLLIISAVCLICTTPGSLLLLVSRFVDGFEFFGKYHNIFVVFSDLSLLLSMINSSVNFIIYMVCNKQFSEAYTTIFCRCGSISTMRKHKPTMTETSKGTTITTVGSTTTNEKIPPFVPDETFTCDEISKDHIGCSPTTEDS